MRLLDKIMGSLRGLFAPKLPNGWGKKYTIRAIGANNKRGEKRTYYMLPYIVPKLRRNVTKLAFKIMDEVPPESMKKFKQLQFINRDLFAMIVSNIEWLVEQDYLAQFVACLLIPEGVSVETHTQAHIDETAKFIDLYMSHSKQMESVLVFFMMLDYPTMLVLWKSIQQTLSNMETIDTQAKK